MTDRAHRDIILMSLEAWDDVWRRNQYFAAGLLRSDPTVRLLFVEPPADPLHALSRRVVPTPPRGLRPAPAIDGVGDGQCWLFQPIKLLPRRIDPRIDQRRARAVLRAARDVDFVRPTLWFNDPSTACLLDLISPASLYDITDDWLAARRPVDEHNRLVRDEATLLDRCDAVTVCSAALAASKRSRHDVTLITNGVDVERYRSPVPRPPDLPPGRVAVYVGTLHSDRLDVDLCERTARALSRTGTLALVGPDALAPSEHDRLISAGVAILGARPFTAVPGYLQHADTLVVPHVVDDFTDSLDPIKLYEYRSVGRPIVSTPVAGFRDAIDDRITVVQGAAFCTEVAAQLTGVRPIDAEPAVDLPTWDRQTRLFGSVIDRIST